MAQRPRGAVLTGAVLTGPDEPSAGGAGMAERGLSMLGGGGIAVRDRAMLGGGGMAERSRAVLGGGGIAEHNTAVAGGGGISEQSSTVLGGGGITEHDTSFASNSITPCCARPAVPSRCRRSIKPPSNKTTAR